MILGSLRLSHSLGTDKCSGRNHECLPAHSCLHTVPWKASAALHGHWVLDSPGLAQLPNHTGKLGGSHPCQLQPSLLSRSLLTSCVPLSKYQQWEPSVRPLASTHRFYCSSTPTHWSACRLNTHSPHPAKLIHSNRAIFVQSRRQQ